MKTRDKFYHEFNLAKPVIKVWSYDGYYEDFSWCSHYVNCKDILEKYNWTIEELDKRIQDLKKKAKKEKSTEYDAFTNSVQTEFGRVSCAMYEYPELTYERLVQLIILCSNVSSIKNIKDKDDLINKIYKNLLKHKEIVMEKVFMIFKD